MKRSLFVVLCALFCFLSKAQTNFTLLNYKDFVSRVLQDHPLARHAQLRTDMADAEWLSAKGAIDPMISSNWNQKSFDQKRYYRHFQTQLTIPTRLGINFVAGYENTDGVFLNPEQTTEPYGLWNVGLEVNVLQGLLVNERRVALQQAQFFRQLFDNQKAMLLNDLLYVATLAYLDWQKYHSYQTIVDENQQLAQTYFDNTKLAFENGEKTGMDTLEAMIVLQDASNLLQSNKAALTKARQNLENFLWENEQPTLLQEDAIPQQYTAALFLDVNRGSVNEMVLQHPLVLEKLNKQSLLEIEQRLKREKLKPKLKVKFNPLLASREDSLWPIYDFTDQKWGIDFSMPLFFRREKAALQMGNIKLKENQLNLSNKQNELLNKLENSIQQQSILQAQLDLQEQSVLGYRRLLDGENERFRFGESSVFLVNKRQEKYINGQLKLIELTTKSQLERLIYWYYSNGIIQQIGEN